MAGQLLLPAPKRRSARSSSKTARARSLEQWTGFQVAWTMARGYPGAFGRHVDALYVWLPLCVLFLLPFVELPPAAVAAEPRPAGAALLLGLAGVLRPRPHLRVGAAVLSAAAVPARAHARAAATQRARAPRLRRRCRLLIPMPVARGRPRLPALLQGRAERHRRQRDRRRLRGRDRREEGGRRRARCTAPGPSDNEHGDTYGPFNYEAYVPFEQIFGWSGTWDDLPAAHAAAVFFDLLAAALLFLIGRRMRGPTLGVALAYAGRPIRSRCSRWRATPTTRCRRCWCSRRCWRRPTARRIATGRARRAVGARGALQARAARARAGAGHPRPARDAAQAQAAGAGAVRGRVRRRVRAGVDPGARRTPR